MAIWKEYIENAYICCFHYLVNKKLHWSERIFWLITIATCVGSAYYFVSMSLTSYYRQRVAFKVDTNYLHWETPFPSVVVCERKAPTSQSVRQFLTNYVGKMRIDESYSNDMKLHIYESAFLIPPNLLINPPPICKEEPSKCSKLNYTESTEKIRSSCSNLLETCSYNGINFTCCNEFLPVTTVYGQCFGFNNYGARYPNGSRVTELKWKIVRKPGMSQGNLTIIGRNKYMFVSILGVNAVPHLKNEMNILLQSHSTYLSEKMVYNYHVQVKEIVSLKEDRLLEVEYKGCRLPNENNLKYFDFYSEANCEIECYIMAQKEYCNCAGHFCPVGPKEQCNINGLVCLNDKKNVEIFPSLKCDCLPDCNTMDVHRVGTIAKLGDPYFKLKKNENKFKLNVIVPIAPTWKLIRYTPTTELDLIVYIGGAVSFFLGVSFLTIAQVLYYFIVRSTTDWYRRENELKTMEKEKKMDENFATAARKLKLGKMERDIKDSMRRKIKEYYIMDEFIKRKNK